MKRTVEKILLLASACIISIALLTSCSADRKDTNDTAQLPSQSEQPESSPSSNDITADKYEEKIAYYMALTESLQQELLDVKEENYITVSNHLMTIKELEASIQRLERIINASFPGESSGNATTKNENSKPSTELVSDTAAYKYIINDGKVTITGYSGRDDDISIPSAIEGLPVVRIGESAFDGALATSISIPKSVRYIDWFAFSNCVSLKEIAIPSSVTSIEYGAFNNHSADLTVICDKNSYAVAYAKSWGMRTEAE